MARMAKRKGLTEPDTAWVNGEVNLIWIKTAIFSKNAKVAARIFKIHNDILQKFKLNKIGRISPEIRTKGDNKTEEITTL